VGKVWASGRANTIPVPLRCPVPGRWTRWVVLAVLLAPTLCRGQSATASVNGTVFDPTGAVIENASLRLENLQTNLVLTTTTNELGHYAFLAVPPGQYLLEASKEGFRTSLSEPFFLRVNQTATIDFTLQVGPIEEVVAVEAAGTEIQGSSAEVGAVIGPRQVTDLPVRGRNFTGLLLLMPGVSPVNVASSSAAGEANLAGKPVFPSVHGRANRSNQFFLDGANNSDVFGSTYAVPPILETIAELRLQSHTDQPESGTVTGGTITVLTRSGTNEFRGAAWEYLRNDVLDARNFFRQGKTPLRQHLYGGTLGGPVLPSKTFFFVGVQGFHRRRPASRLYRVPTEANLQGDLTDWPWPIFDPWSTRPDPLQPGGFVRDPFPGNRLPASLLDAGMLRYARYTLPAPIETGVPAFNQLDLTPVRRDQVEFSGRVDHALTRKTLIWIRGGGSISNLDSSGGRQGLLQYDDLNTLSIGLSWVRISGPRSIWEFTFAHTSVERERGRRFRDVPENLREQVGFNGAYTRFRSGFELVPDLQVAQFFSGGESHEYQLPGEVRQFRAGYSRIRGRHTWKLGGEWNGLGFRQILNELASGFHTEATADPRRPAQTGSPLASWLLDVPYRAERRDYFKQTRFGGIASFYFQDSWKVTPRLTMNFGLRYDYTRIPSMGRRSDRTIYTGNLDLIRGVYWLQELPPSCAEAGEAPCLPSPQGALPEHVLLAPGGRLLSDYKDNWQPRVGLAYRFGARTALRASFGIFFDSWAGVLEAVQHLGHGWPDVGERLAENLNKPNWVQWTPVVSSKNPFPGVAMPDPDPFGQGGWFRDREFRNAYSLQWSLSLQRELSRTASLTAAYVGSGNRRLPLGGFYNVARVPGPGEAASRRPFPYISPANFDRSWGRGHYHAFQLQLQKRYSKGLSFTASYTWSKAIDIGCSGYFDEGCAIQDPYRFNLDRSVAATDVPHMLSLSWVYELPFGQSKWLRIGNRFLDGLFRGWQVNGIAMVRSGQPFTVFLEGDPANTGNRSGYARPDVVASPALDEPRPERWFRIEAFQAPGPYRFGNAGRNILRGDGQVNFDLSVFRNFLLPWRERMRLQLRLEAFNAFNTPQFDLPVANLSDPNFGRVISARNEREVQVGLKLEF